MLMDGQVRDFFKTDWAWGVGRANPWSLCIFWPLFSWGVKSIAFNPSLVHKRSPQSNPDIRFAPCKSFTAVNSPWLNSSGLVAVNQRQTNVFFLYIFGASVLQKKAQLCSCLLLSCKLQSLLLVNDNGEGGRNGQERSGWLGQSFMCSRMQLPDWLQLMFSDLIQSSLPALHCHCNMPGGLFL